MSKQPDIELRKLTELRRIADALEIIARAAGPQKVIVREPEEVDPDPEWERATTTGPRKHWGQEAMETPPDDRPGWELDPERGRPGESWDRFDYHEEVYWRRPVVKPMGDGD